MQRAQPSASSISTASTTSSRGSVDTLHSLARSISTTQVSPRRGTFAFDDVLYKDRTLEVTPSLLMVSRPLVPFLGAKEIPISEISRVCRDFNAPPPPPTAWRPSRMSLDAGARRSRRRSVPGARGSRNSLVLVFSDRSPVRVPVEARDPSEAYEAVKNAINTVYEQT